MRHLASLAFALVALVTARVSSAQDLDPLPSPMITAPARDAVEPPPDAPKVTDVRRPWLYAPDPTAPPPGHVVATMDVGIVSIDRGAARPFAADEPDGGIKHFVGPNAELDLLSHHVRLLGGPAFGLSVGSPRVLGRLAAMYVF